MTLSEIQEEWIKDSRIDLLNLAEEAARVPVLHAKYMKILTSTRLQQRKVEAEYKQYKKLKERYYRGELSKEELNENGWGQYLHNRPLKNEIDSVLDADDDMIKKIDKIEYYKTMMVLLEQIIKSINSRTWDVKSAIDWKKFTGGA